jgi:hypothetical protein
LLGDHAAFVGREEEHRVRDVGGFDVILEALLVDDARQLIRLHP